jgi:hypothetical protein
VVNCRKYTAKNDQVVAMLMKTGLNNALLPTMFIAVNNIEQYCYTRFRLNKYCSILLTSVNNVGSKTLFNPVEQRARRFLPAKNAQPVTMLLKTGLNNVLLPILLLVSNKNNHV